MKCELPLYEYTCRTPNGPIRVASFRQVVGKLAGRIVAPEGSSLRGAGQASAKLKVPKEGRPGEFWLLDADEARAAAAAGKFGLAWEPSGSNAEARTDA